MNISDILDSVKSGKLSVNDAKKQLSLYSIEEIEKFDAAQANGSEQLPALSPEAKRLKETGLVTEQW